MHNATEARPAAAPRHSLLFGLRVRLQSIVGPCAARDCQDVDREWYRVPRRVRRVKVQDRWYCASRCLERAAADAVVALKASSRPGPAGGYRMPLGLLMVSQGQLNFEQLRRALDAQNNASHRRLGEWLQDLGFTTEERITAALSVQWACPTLRITPDAQFSCARLLPRTLQQAYCMLPVHFTPQSRTLYVGFGDRIAHRMLYAVDQMLTCRTIPCLVTGQALSDAMQRVDANAGWSEAAFERGSDADETGHIIAGYAQRCSAHEVRVTSCGEFIWARLFSRRTQFDLLFRTA